MACSNADEATERRVSHRVTKTSARLAARVRRAFGRFGIGTDTVLLIGKSVIAAGIAWYLADEVLQMSSPTFAPFSAILLMHTTLARSVVHAGRYVLAMIGGVVLAGILAPVLGPGVLTFAALVLLALIIGQWQRLGSQGSQVAVAAMFAYQSMVMVPTWRASFVQLGEIGGLILLGAAVGLATNLVFVPPMRHRWGQRSVHSSAHRISDELADIARGVNAGSLDEDQTRQWSERVAELPDMVEQTRRNLDDAAESLRFNPRRLFFSSTPTFIGYRHILGALSSVANQLYPITRSLGFLADGEAADDQQQFLHSLGDVLDSVAGAVRFLGEIHSLQDLAEEHNELRHCVDDARESLDQLCERLHPERLVGPGAWPAYESLHADARRLVEDLARAEHELAQHAG